MSMLRRHAECPKIRAGGRVTKEIAPRSSYLTSEVIERLHAAALDDSDSSNVPPKGKGNTAPKDEKGGKTSKKGKKVREASAVETAAGSLEKKAAEEVGKGKKRKEAKAKVKKTQKVSQAREVVPEQDTETTASGAGKTAAKKSGAKKAAARPRASSVPPATKVVAKKAAAKKAVTEKTSSAAQAAAPAEATAAKTAPVRKTSARKKASAKKVAAMGTPETEG